VIDLKEKSVIVTEEFKIVSDLTYHSLQTAGEICRVNCHEQPNLLDAIANGIKRFLEDGDIYNNVIIALIDENPDLVGYCLGLTEVDVAKKVMDAMTETVTNR
jgi:hypothetical protein